MEVDHLAAILAPFFAATDTESGSHWHRRGRVKDSAVSIDFARD
jgi:hypothetical protein